MTVKATMRFGSGGVVHMPKMVRFLTTGYSVSFDDRWVSDGLIKTTRCSTGVPIAWLTPLGEKAFLSILKTNFTKEMNATTFEKFLRKGDAVLHDGRIIALNSITDRFYTFSSYSGNEPTSSLLLDYSVVAYPEDIPWAERLAENLLTATDVLEDLSLLSYEDNLLAFAVFHELMKCPIFCRRMTGVHSII